jgi:hypothetical protein
MVTSACSLPLNYGWSGTVHFESSWHMRRLLSVAFVGLVWCAMAVDLMGQQPSVTDVDRSAGSDWLDADFWTTLDGRPVTDNWQFVEGEIRLAEPRGGGGSLLSKPMPANFELSFEWKIEAGANTGLKYRVREFGANRYLGVEYQIIDAPGMNRPKGITASIYDLFAPKLDEVDFAIDEWNRAKIVAVGNRLEHFLNGKRVASATAFGPTWDKAIALSKFYGDEDFGRPRAGDRFMLTDHGGKAAYRNFQFVDKSAESSDQETTELTGPFLANAMRNAWADQDSVVVWTRTTRRPEMNVEGKRFVSLSRKQASKYSRSNDAKELLEIQLPDGADLS